MANVLEYTLSLNDQVSTKLQKIGVASETSLTIFANLQKQTNTVNKVMGDMGRTVGSLQQKVALLKNERDWIPKTAITDIRKYNSEIKSLEKEIHKLQTINGSKFKTLLKDAVRQMPGSAFITNPIVAAGAGLGVITKLGIENEKTAVSFEVLLGSQEKAAKMIQEMTSYGASTPYEKANLQEAGKLMLSFGVAHERIMPNLKMIGDIAMGDANKMNSLTLAYSQISSAGKLTGQDLLQLINAGFNPLNEISKMTGRSMADLRKDMEKGKISAEMVTAAFEHATGPGGQFYEMTKKIGQTIGGRLSTAIDNLKEVALNLFNVIAPLLSPALQAVNFILGAIVGALTWFFDGLEAGNPLIIGLSIALGYVAAALTVNYLLTKRAVIWTRIKEVWDKISATTMGVLTGAIWKQNAALLANPLGWVIMLVAALVAAIIVVISKTEGWGKQWDRVVNMASASFSVFVDGFMIGIDKIKLGWYKFKNTLGFGDKAENRKIIDQLTADVERRKKEIEGAKQKLKDNAKWEITWKEKKAKTGLENSGIAAPTIPGTNMEQAATGSVKENGNKTTSAVASGGTRNTSININLGKMIESIIFQGGVKENSNDMVRQIEDVMLRVLYAAQSAG